jgi:ESS family glutamate:Na+ symporter
VALLADAIVPLSVLLVVGFIWTAVCLVVLAPRLLPSAYWFELGLINYGMSTGVTASGLMLLRIIDKDFDSGAAEDYALAAPFSSPFVGGGLITIVVVPSMIQSLGVGPTGLIALAAACGLYGVGIVVARRESEAPPAAGASDR